MLKVLLADDSMAVRKVAERLLTQAGFEVALAASGEEALAWLAKEHPDLIISDVIMPGRSGYDVCTFVRSQASLAGTPVLLISGIVNDEVAKQVELCRADGVLKKPFQGSSLQDKVMALLAQKQPGTAAAAPAPAPAFMAPPSPPPAPAPVAAAPPPPPPAPAPTFSPPPPPPAPAAPAFDPTATTKVDLTQTTKVYRITEDKLQAFRQAVVRVKDLETALAEEQEQSLRLVEQLEATVQQGGGARVQQLEGMLAEEQKRSAQLVKRVEELERALVAANERVSQIAKLLQTG